jgi:hypothetical protein
MYSRNPSDVALRVSGKEFNDKLANDPAFRFYKKELVKLTVENNIHNDFEFKEGLNVDIVPFNVSRICSKGGFYFTFSHCWNEWLDYGYKFMYWMWDVKIPEDASVYLESETKIKANKIILENKRYIYDCEERCMLAMRQNINVFRFIEDPSETVQLEAVRRDGHSIRFVKDPSEEVQIEAVRRYGTAIRFIKDPSDEMKLEAVRQDGDAIQFIKDPSEEVKLEAVKQSGYVIQFVKDSSEKVKLEAVRQNGNAIQFIKYPSEIVQLEAVRQNRFSIKFIKDPSEAVKRRY